MPCVFLPDSSNKPYSFLILQSRQRFFRRSASGGRRPRQLRRTQAGQIPFIRFSTQVRTDWIIKWPGHLCQCPADLLGKPPNVGLSPVHSPERLSAWALSGRRDDLLHPGRRKAAHERTYPAGGTGSTHGYFPLVPDFVPCYNFLCNREKENKTIREGRNDGKICL